MIRQMKDSDILWIGQIPETWTIDKFKYHLLRKELRNKGNATVLSLYRDLGIVPKASRDDNHNRTSEDTSKYKWVQKGSFVVNKMKAWQGSVAVSEYEGIVSPAYYVYYFYGNKIHTRFFHFLMRTCYKDEFMRLSGGIRVDQWDLPAEGLENTLIIIPPLKEQQRIAGYLDKKCAEIDTLSQNIQKQIDTLEQYKRAVITETVTKGLNPSAPMKDSGIPWVGKVPESWEILPNKYVMHKEKQICPLYNGEPILSLSMEGVLIRDIENPSGKMPASFDGYQKIKAGNLLMCLFDMDVTPRCIGLIKNTGLTSPAYSQFVLHENALAEYFYYYYLSLDFTKELVHLAKNLRHALTEDVLGTIKVPVPPKSEQQAIADYLDDKCGKIDAIIQDKQQQLEKLEQYKKATIFEYVTGKKQVPEV